VELRDSFVNRQKVSRFRNLTHGYSDRPFHKQLWKKEKTTEIEPKRVAVFNYSTTIIGLLSLVRDVQVDVLP